MEYTRFPHSTIVELYDYSFAFVSHYIRITYMLKYPFKFVFKCCRGIYVYTYVPMYSKVSLEYTLFKMLFFASR